MFLNNIKIGAKAPEEFNVIIEISAGSSAVKYEMDKESGIISVDRFLSVAMYYPCNYGFIPQTMGGDQDPLDVLLLSSCPIQPGALIKARAVGVLLLEDEAGKDEKIIAVPLVSIDPHLRHINDVEDLSPSWCAQVQHFFAHYKDLEKDKWVRVQSFEKAKIARDLISSSLCDNSADE